MSMWDGLTTSNDTRILVLGATNRPNDIDSAILRRMPKRFAIKLPDAHQRRNILTLMLKDIRLEPGFDIEALVKKTDGLSGSDLKEACRNAAMVRPSPSFSLSLFRLGAHPFRWAGPGARVHAQEPRQRPGRPREGPSRGASSLSCPSSLARARD